MLSSNTLFHFTSNVDIIAKILINGFRPSYCYEDFSFLNEKHDISEFHIPMVCFCDIPLSKIKKHSENYGKYGLGMDINWGIENGISPITYTLKRSHVYYSLQVFERLFSFASVKNENEILDFSGHSKAASELSILKWNIIPMLCYLKPCRAIDLISGLIRKYYDEKEWRFIPGFSTFPNRNPFFLRIPTTYSLDNEIGRMFLRKDYFSALGMQVEEALELGKKLVQAKFLKFKIDDLKYLIVQHEKDIYDLVEIINQSGKFSKKDIEKILCRTITYKQIEDDF
jgi:hypothetical protein